MTQHALAIPDINDERLIRDGEAAAAAYAKSTKENILPMARGLVAARRKYPSNQEFGRWYDRSPYPAAVTNHSMRAALIRIGEHEDNAAEIIENSDSVDPVAIVAAIKGASSQKVKTAPRKANYVATLKKFGATTTAAIDGVDEFSPETVAEISDLIEKIEAGLKLLQEKLKAASCP